MTLLAKESMLGNSEISASDIKHQIISIDIDINYNMNEEVLQQNQFDISTLV